MKSNNIKIILLVGVIVAAAFAGYLIFSKKEVRQIYSSEYCLRSTPYALRPEFQRSMSLILQRSEENLANDQQNLNINERIKAIENCIFIQYADSDTEIGGAEGVFKLDEASSNRNELTILVSPRYKVKDDLLTAVLLVHELIHASNFTLAKVSQMTIVNCISSGGTQSDCEVQFPSYKLSCIDDEFSAFISQFVFFASYLTKEERLSLISRGILESSEETKNLNKFTSKFKGDYSLEQLRKDLENDPFYKQQCNLS